MKNLFRAAAIAAITSALSMGGALARASTTLPPVHKSGAIEYLSGGIGQDESMAIERAGRQWPLTLEFAVKDRRRADFAADVATTVRDTKGHVVLHTNSDGPFLLARLAPGHYAVDATLGGKTLHEKVLVKHGEPAKAVFLWPAGTGDARS